MKQRILFIIIVLCSLNVLAQEKCVLSESKYAECIQCDNKDQLIVVYLNGINNELTEAINSEDQIKKILDDKKFIAGISSDNICTGLTYNQTVGFISDTIEVFSQKLNEINKNYGTAFNEKDLSKYIFKKATFITFAAQAILAGGTVGTFEAARSIVLGLFFTVATEKNKEILSNQHYETAQEVFGDLSTTIKSNQQSIILVSHSQGNLFANILSDMLQSSEDSLLSNFAQEKFANLQVATPANIIVASKSDYLTHPDDFVIDDLLNSGLLGFSILQPNFEFYDVEFKADIVKHSFVNTYTSKYAYGSLDETYIGNSEYKQYCADYGSGAVIDCSKSILVDGNLVEIETLEDPTNKKIAKMSDIFYEKLNNLAKQVYPFGSCSSSSWDDLKALGLDIEFHKDINGNITSYDVFRMVNGQKSYEDIYKSDFLLSVQYKKPFSSVIYSAELGKPGEILSSEQSDILSRANWLYLSYAGNYSYADDTVTSIQNGCKVFPYRISVLNLSVGPLEYGLISTIRINKGGDYTSIKVFESETDDNASPIGVPVELFSWNNDLELPPVIQNGTNEYSFQVQSKINKAIIVEICNYFNCSSNRVNVSLPKIVVHKSIHDDVGDMSPGVDILNTPPVRPQDDFTYNYSFGDSGDVSFILRGMRAPYGGTIYNWYTTYTCGTYDETIGGWSGFSYTIPWRASQETDLLSGGNLNSDGYISNIEREVIVDIFYPESENVSIEPMQFTFSELSCFQ